MTRMVGITCKHVKGIESLDVHCDFHPNKPNFLVAPNGSGKSSLATAFASLNSRRLNLADGDRYNGEDWDDCSLTVSFENGETLSASADLNEIAKVADVQVIRSGLYANMTNRRVGPRVLSQTKMSVQRCVLYDKVPRNVRLDYSIKTEREKYPSCIRGKMDNLAQEFKSYRFLNELLCCDEAFRPTKGARYDAAVKGFLNNAPLFEVSDDDKSACEKEAVEAIASVKPLVAIKEILDRWFPGKGDVSNYLNAIQINRFIDGKRGEIREACAYLRYCEVKRGINDMLPLLDRTRFKVRAHVEKSQLVVDFPDWDDASNGEIDVLQLCVSLFRARAKLGEKEKSLLIIDEVFDYLDDANLLVAQHFLLELMKQFKDAGKSIYVVILTHLDPSQFKSFRFKKFHTSYISPVENGAEKGCLHKILVDRRRCQIEQQHIYEAVSSHYLHFSDCQAVSEDVRAYVAQQMIGNAPKEPASFRNEMESRLGDYFSEKPFSSSEVCCGIRIAVERLCYEALTSKEAKQQYLEIKKGTEERLRYAETHGVEVPETFHLLGSIYNSCMYLSNTPGELEIVRRQLGNNIIRHMIRTSLEGFGWSMADDAPATC